MQKPVLRPTSIYIATRFANRVAARTFGKELESEFGFRWFQDYNWTDLTKPTVPNSPAGGRVSQLDIRGASFADVFVKILTKTSSLGAFAELGARIGLGRVAHVIENCHTTHLFHHHPLVRRYADQDEFCEAVRRYLNGETLWVAPPNQEYTGGSPY